MVYWDGQMSLVKLGWTTSSKYSFEKNILTAIWSTWIYRAKLIFSPWFHLYFWPSQLHQIYRSSLGNQNQYNFFGKIFLVCDFSGFTLDEACRKGQLKKAPCRCQKEALLKRIWWVWLQQTSLWPEKNCTHSWYDKRLGLYVFKHQPSKYCLSFHHGAFCEFLDTLKSKTSLKRFWWVWLQ